MSELNISNIYSEERLINLAKNYPSNFVNEFIDIIKEVKNKKELFDRLCNLCNNINEENFKIFSKKPDFPIIVRCDNDKIFIFYNHIAFSNDSDNNSTPYQIEIKKNGQIELLSKNGKIYSNYYECPETLLGIIVTLLVTHYNFSQKII